MNRTVSTVALGLLVAMSLSTVALANCKPGTKNCIMGNRSIPTFCGSVSKPCVIDGGLGSSCKGDVVCGTGSTSPLGDPPYGTNLPGGGTTFFVRSGGTHPHVAGAFSGLRVGFHR